MEKCAWTWYPLVSICCQSPSLLERCFSYRRTPATARNATSSRSHALSTIRTKNLVPVLKDRKILLVESLLHVALVYSFREYQCNWFKCLQTKQIPDYVKHNGYMKYLHGIYQHGHPAIVKQIRYSRPDTQVDLMRVLQTTPLENSIWPGSPNQIRQKTHWWLRGP